MGRGAVNVPQRIAASLGQANAVVPQFQHTLDVPCAGVLFALPALLALGLLDTAHESLNPLPKGYYGLDSILLLLPERPQQHRATAGRGQCPDQPGAVPAVETARTETHRRQNPQGRAALAAAGRSLLLRAAHPQPVADAVLERVEALLQLQGPDLLRYRDKKRGQRRTIHLVEHNSHSALEAFLLAGDTSAQSWITPLLKESLPAHPYGRALLVPGATPTLPVASRGQQVCSCFNVTDVAIAKHLAACHGTPGQRLASRQGALKCGTNCGSCLPQVRGMVGA